MPNNGHLYHTGDTCTIIANVNTNNDYRTGQDRYQVHIFPTEIEHTELISKENNNDVPIQSSESKIEHSLPNSKQDLELSQVYDAVSPKLSEAKEAVSGMVYDQLTHSSHHGKHSLPAYLGSAPEYSALSVWKDSPHTKFLGDSMPVYDTPDVKIKGKKSELSTMMPPSHKISSCSCPPLPLSDLESKDADREHTYAILEQDHLQQSIHMQTSNIEHTCAVLEQSQQQQSAANVQTVNTESNHMYAILEQDRVEKSSPNEGNAREVDMAHAYAILEQDQQTESEYHILEEEGQSTNSWMSSSLQSQESQLERKHSRSKQRNANFELVQIYSTVSPKPPKTRRATVASWQHSHQACSKKQSLPSYLGAQPTHTEHSAATDSRNAPDVKKKKPRKMKKGSEGPNNCTGEAAMAAASRKISTASCPPLSLLTESEDANTNSKCNTIDELHTSVGDSFQHRNT